MAGEQAVVLVESRPEEWAARYERLVAVLRAAVPDGAFEHIGSTAVPGLPAKDVVDILIGVDASAIESVARSLEDHGFDLEGVRAGHCWLSHPDRRHRECVLHVVATGHAIWRERLAFRDLLRADATARDEYLRVKRAAAQSSTGWGDYTAAKAPIVAELLERSRAQGGPATP